jgi:hypothetical protein
VKVNFEGEGESQKFLRSPDIDDDDDQMPKIIMGHKII